MFVHIRQRSLIFVHIHSYSPISMHIRPYSFVFAHIRSYSLIFSHIRPGLPMLVHIRSYSFIFRHISHDFRLYFVYVSFILLLFPSFSFNIPLFAFIFLYISFLMPLHCLHSGQAQPELLSCFFRGNTFFIELRKESKTSDKTWEKEKRKKK